MIETRLSAEEDSLDLKVEEVEEKRRGIITTRLYWKDKFMVEYAGELVDEGMAKDLEAKYALDVTAGCYMYYYCDEGRQYWYA